MAKYHEWTFGDAEALINVLGGDQIAREIKDQKRYFTVGDLIRPEPPARPPLTGRVAKTIIIPAYSTADFAAAIRLGNFDNARDLGDVTLQWSKEPVGLAKPTKVDLVEFDRDWWMDEAIAWGVANGNKKPIGPAHLLGIAAGLPEEQRERPIVELGSVREGSVLYLGGGSGWRSLNRRTVKGSWLRRCLVGFVSESAV